MEHPRAVSGLHATWLLVFAVDAMRSGHGRAHQLGSLALGLLFATLLVLELRSYRRTHPDVTAEATPAPSR